MNTSTQEKIESQLAAYALGALDVDEMVELEQALENSPEYRQELRRLREVVGHLPYAAPPVTPPANIRERLMARVAADQQTRPAAPAAVAPAPNVRPARRWIAPTMISILSVLVLIFGGITLSLQQTVSGLIATNSALVTTVERLQDNLEDTQQQQARLSDDLRAGQLQIEQLQNRLKQDQTVIAYVSAPGVATRELSTGNGGVARGEMYMVPGDPNAVVLFSGLPTLQTDRVYQFWLADGGNQVAAGTFTVDESGIATLIVEAPREVNAYQEVMVTVEPSGGSATPSTQVVLSGSL